MESSNVVVVHAIAYFLSVKTKEGSMGNGSDFLLYHIASYDKTTYSS